MLCGGARSAAVPAVRNSDGLVHLAGYVLHLRPTFWPNIFLIESSVIRATASADGGKKQRERSRLEGKHTPTQYRSQLRRQEERILKAKSDSSASREDGWGVNGDTYRPYTWVRFFYFLCHTIRFSEASFSLLDNIIILSVSKISSNFWFSCVPRKMIVLLALFIWPCRTPGPASLLHASCIWLSRAAYFELVIYYFKNSSYNWYYFSIFTG
jgi:hypothetical protein